MIQLISCHRQLRVPPFFMKRNSKYFYPQTFQIIFKISFHYSFYLIWRRRRLKLTPAQTVSSFTFPLRPDKTKLSVPNPRKRSTTSPTFRKQKLHKLYIEKTKIILYTLLVISSSSQFLTYKIIELYKQISKTIHYKKNK